MSDPLLDKITRAKLKLILHAHPFFGMLTGYLKLVRCDDETIVPTMATNGTHLYWHPSFVEKLDEKELQFVLAHEVLHNAFEHHIRRKERDPQLWNIACDFVINLTLVDSGMAMPTSVPGLLDKKYAGMTSEEVYAELQKNAVTITIPMTGPDPGGMGGVLDGNKAPGQDGSQPLNANQVEELRAEQQMRIRQVAAATKAKMAGKLPANLQRLIDELTEARIDWQSQLRRLINSLSSFDYTWARPNRRYIHMGHYFPGALPDAIGHIVVCVDTSGSIGPDILNEFAGEIRGILDDGNCDRITVIYADATVSSVETFERGDTLTLHPSGGGGTAFSDTFRHIAETIDDAAAVIYLTDMYTSDWGEEPNVPVIWAVTGRKETFQQLADAAPFGDAIHIPEAA
jgi:predicted metal-dependent peptidase